MTKNMTVSEILNILNYFNSPKNTIYTNNTLSTTVFWRLRKNLQKLTKIQQIAAETEKQITEKYAIYTDEEHTEPCLAYQDGKVCFDEKGELILDKNHPLIKDIDGVTEGRRVKVEYADKMVDKQREINELLDQSNEIDIEAITFSHIENATLNFSEIEMLAWMIDDEPKTENKE